MPPDCLALEYGQRIRAKAKRGWVIAYVCNIKSAPFEVVLVLVLSPSPTAACLAHSPSLSG